MPESQTADLAFMRELNERIVLNLIRHEAPIVRAALARRSNLGRSTISRIISALIAATAEPDVCIPHIVDLITMVIHKAGVPAEQLFGRHVSWRCHLQCIEPHKPWLRLTAF